MTPKAIDKFYAIRNEFLPPLDGGFGPPHFLDFSTQLWYFGMLSMF